MIRLFSVLPYYRTLLNLETAFQVDKCSGNLGVVTNYTDLSSFPPIITDDSLTFYSDSFCGMNVVCYDSATHCFLPELTNGFVLLLFLLLFLFVFLFLFLCLSELILIKVPILRLVMSKCNTKYLISQVLPRLQEVGIQRRLACGGRKTWYCLR